MLIKYLNRSYFSGRIRWLLTDKKGNSVYCCQCGNIANGVAHKKILFLNFYIPYCGKHLIIASGRDNLNLPCVVKIP